MLNVCTNINDLFLPAMLDSSTHDATFKRGATSSSLRRNLHVAFQQRIAWAKYINRKAAVLLLSALLIIIYDITVSYSKVLILTRQ